MAFYRTLTLLTGILSALASSAQPCLNDERDISQAAMKRTGVRELRIYRGAAAGRTLSAHYFFDREGCAIRMIRYDPTGEAGKMTRTTHALSDDRLGRSWISGEVARNGVFVRASGGTELYSPSGKLYRQVQTVYGKVRETIVREYDTVLLRVTSTLRYQIHDWTLDTFAIEEEHNHPGLNVIRKLEKKGGIWQEASRYEAVYRNGRLYESRLYMNGELRLYWNENQDRRIRPYGEAPPFNDPSMSDIASVSQRVSDTLYLDHLSAPPKAGRKGPYQVVLHYAGSDSKELLYKEIYRSGDGLLLQRLYPREPEQNEFYAYVF